MMHEISPRYNILIMGKQASGKGTQADLLAAEIEIPHISTGDICRRISQEDSDLGRAVKNLIDNGQLAPDDLMNDLVAKRVAEADCQKGFILDGYPRKIYQTNFFDKHTPVDYCVLVEISDEEAITRMMARRICCDCKAGYNVISIKPKKDGVCDKCNGKLVMRADDNPEAIKKRLDIFREETVPVVDFYRKKGVFVSVNGEQPIESVFRDILKVMNYKKK